jgi:hypothetical protein
MFLWAAILADTIPLALGASSGESRSNRALLVFVGPREEFTYCCVSATGVAIVLLFRRMLRVGKLGSDRF